MKQNTVSHVTGEILNILKGCGLINQGELNYIQIGNQINHSLLNDSRLNQEKIFRCHITTSKG